MKTLYGLLAVLGLLMTTSVVSAQDHGCGCEAAGGACHGSCGRCPACPKCSNKICTSSVERIKEEHHCFKVECKEICVPAITLPCWTDAIPFFKCKDKSCDTGCGCGNKCPSKECCPAPRCGYVKVVKVLKKHEYECDSCGYKWNIEAPGCNSGACATGACAAGAACDSAYSAPANMEQTYEQAPVPPQTNHAPATGVYRGADLRFSK